VPATDIKGLLGMDEGDASLSATDIVGGEEGGTDMEACAIKGLLGIDEGGINKPGMLGIDEGGASLSATDIVGGEEGGTDMEACAIKGLPGIDGGGINKPGIKQNSNKMGGINKPGMKQNSNKRKSRSCTVRNKKRRLSSRATASKKDDGKEAAILIYPFAGNYDEIEGCATGLDPALKSDISISEDDIEEAHGTALSTPWTPATKRKGNRAHYISITANDLELLNNPRGWLNDSLIDFWMKW